MKKKKKSRKWLCRIGLHSYIKETFLHSFKVVMLDECRRCGKVRIKTRRAKKKQLPS